MKMFIIKTFIVTGLTIAFLACGKDEATKKPNDEGGSTKDLTATTGIDKFSLDNVFSINTHLLANNVMQGFSLDSDGSVWYTQSTENKNQINWVKGQRNTNTSIYTANTEYMKLTYFGHATNTAVEEVGNDRYLWIGAYGSANAKGEYWNEKVIGRVKYEKGKTVKTNECNEYYYIGNYHDMHAAIDAENDLLTINYADDANSQFRCFVTYKLSEAKSASSANFVITCTNGFETGVSASTTVKSVTVYAKDLTSITPVARYKFRKTGYGASGATYYDWQGYDVYKDRLYYAEGQSNYNLYGSFYTDGTSEAYLTVFDFNGNVVEERTKVAVISNKTKLNEIGITKLGHMEAEGVKVYGNKLYLGFSSRGITEQDTKHYQNILVYNRATK